MRSIAKWRHVAKRRAPKGNLFLRHSNKTTVAHVCHSERSEESHSWGLLETLRFAQGDKREVLLECPNRFLDSARNDIPLRLRLYTAPVGLSDPSRVAADRYSEDVSAALAVILGCAKTTWRSVPLALILIRSPLFFSVRSGQRTISTFASRYPFSTAWSSRSYHRTFGHSPAGLRRLVCTASRREGLIYKLL